jgi:hypothetical protein
MPNLDLGMIKSLP